MRSPENRRRGAAAFCAAITLALLLACLIVALLDGGQAHASSADCQPAPGRFFRDARWAGAKARNALVGTVVHHGEPLAADTGACRYTPMQQLAEMVERTIRQGGLVLLGEVHDNPEHHALRADLLWPRRFRTGTQRLAAVAVFEHLRTDQQPEIEAFYERRAKSRAVLAADELLRGLAWSKSGWPAADMFLPLFNAALGARLRILPGDPPRDRIRTISRQGRTAITDDEADRLGLATPLPDDQQEALLSELEGSHCGLMPRSAFTSMAVAQRYRDAHLADAMLAAAERHGAAFLLAGNGHVRKDRGVPHYLGARAPAKPVLAVMLVEVEEGKSAIADYGLRDTRGRPVADVVVFTPRAMRPDPCADLKARMSRPPAAAPDASAAPRNVPAEAPPVATAPPSAPVAPGETAPAPAAPARQP